MQSSTVGYQSDVVLVVVFQQFLAHLIIVLPMCGMFDSGSDYFVVDKMRYKFSLITVNTNTRSPIGKSQKATRANCW